MAKTLLDLAERLQKLGESIEQQASDAAVDVAFAVLENLVMVTPVDTSEALSNWQISLGETSYNKLPPYVPGYLGYTAAASQREAIAAAKRQLANKKPGQSIFISNNAEHIVKLNEGSSAQAPAGFVERAALIGHIRAKNIKIKV